MDYKKLYQKLKAKYILNKLHGGDICNTDFQNSMDLKLDYKDYKIYHGSTEVLNNQPIESKCDLDDLYEKCKIYLDSLDKIEEFILWIYTDGSLARLLNNYLLHNKKIKTFYESSDTFYAICSQIKWYYF